MTTSQEAASSQVSCFMRKINPCWLSHYGWSLVCVADGNSNWHTDQFMARLLQQPF